jgi:hypothetical protein
VTIVVIHVGLQGEVPLGGVKRCRRFRPPVHFDLSICLSVCLSICISICIIYIYIMHMPEYLCVYISMNHTTHICMYYLFICIIYIHIMHMPKYLCVYIFLMNHTTHMCMYTHTR